MPAPLSMIGGCPTCGHLLPPHASASATNCAECGHAFTPVQVSVRAELIALRWSALALALNAMTLLFLLLVGVPFIMISFLASVGTGTTLAVVASLMASTYLGAIASPACAAVAAACMARACARRVPRVRAQLIVAGTATGVLIAGSVTLYAVMAIGGTDPGSVPQLRAISELLQSVIGTQGLIVLSLVGPFVPLVMVAIHACVCAVLVTPRRRKVLRWLTSAMILQWLLIGSLPLALIAVQSLPEALVIAAAMLLVGSMLLVACALAITLRGALNVAERAETAPAFTARATWWWLVPILAAGLAVLITPIAVPQDVARQMESIPFWLLVRMGVAVAAAAAWVFPWALSRNRRTWKCALPVSALVALGIALRMYQLFTDEAASA